MRRSVVVSVLSGGLLFGLGLATGLVAQTLTDSPQRVEQKRSDLSGAPGMEVIASTGEYKPGDSVMLHIHHGVEAAYVLQGAMVQSPGKDPAPLPTGTTLTCYSRPGRSVPIPPCAGAKLSKSACVPGLRC